MSRLKQSASFMEYLIATHPQITDLRRLECFNCLGGCYNCDRNTQIPTSSSSQQRDYADPSTSFVISVQDGKIVVEYMKPGSGEVVNYYYYYSSKSARQLYQQIGLAE